MATAPNPPDVGASVKVFLPGESPWAECVTILPDGRWIGRIENKLVAQSPEVRQQIAAHFGRLNDELPKLHDYEQNDLVLLVAVPLDDVWLWQPAPQQIKSAARQ